MRADIPPKRCQHNGGEILTGPSRRHFLGDLIRHPPFRQTASAFHLRQRLLPRLSAHAVPIAELARHGADSIGPSIAREQPIEQRVAMDLGAEAHNQPRLAELREAVAVRAIEPHRCPSECAE